MLEQKFTGRDAMLYYFLSLLTAAIILLGNHPRSETNRWAAVFLISASIGGLADILAENGLPGWSGALQFLNQTLTPYGVLVFSMVYAERFPAGQDAPDDEMAAYAARRGHAGGYAFPSGAGT
ncbi:hypothetical protein [Paenibacillus dendritiformis]|uniref:hypothetical protein n=1 Tax=Paenibacillus dendritiformis TaxID=130049 RepID=UPI00387E106E